MYGELCPNRSTTRVLRSIRASSLVLSVTLQLR
jgi:hypothetical protein